MGMVIGLFVQIALIALVAFGIRAIRQRRTSAPLGTQLRNVFHYLVVLALALATASGLSGLLGMVADRANFVKDNSSELALNLSLLFVGAPLLVVFGLWTKRRITRDPLETESPGWTLFVTIALLVPLVVTLFGAYALLRFAFRADDYDGFALAQAVVWGATWFGVDRLDRRFTRGPQTTFRHVAAALIGLVLGAVGAGQLVAAILDRLFTPGSLDAVLVDNTDLLASAIALLFIGAAVWIRYWVRGLSASPDSEGWRLYVVLFGVAGGLITAIVAGATVLYRVAVWFLGTPSATDIGDHFSSTPSALGAACAGLVVWAYHRAVLAARRGIQRTEIDRTYDYVMAIGGLIATGVGVVILLGAFVEALTGGALLAGDPALNTLLLAVVLLIIGLPVWWVHWRAAGLHYASGEPDEIASVSRRVYLISLIGIGGLVALGTGIATVYIFLRDVIDGTLSSATVRSLRIPMATLITSGAIATYHLSCFRSEHEIRVASSPEIARRRVVLVGPFDASIDQFVRERGESQVEWIATQSGTWSEAELSAILTEHEGDVVVSLSLSGAFGASLRTP
jgi:hypothetical protein